MVNLYPVDCLRFGACGNDIGCQVMIDLYRVDGVRFRITCINPYCVNCLRFWP